MIWVVYLLRKFVLHCFHNVILIFFFFTELVEVDVSAVRESQLTLSLTKTNALCTTLKNSTTQESMRCPWTWRIWFKFSRHLLQKPTSHIQKRSWPFNDLSIPRKVTTTKKRMLKIWASGSLNVKIHRYLF